MSNAAYVRVPLCTLCGLTRPSRYSTPSATPSPTCRSTSSGPAPSCTQSVCPCACTPLPADALPVCAVASRHYTRCSELYQQLLDSTKHAAWALSLGHHPLTFGAFLPTHLLPALLLDPGPVSCHHPPSLLAKCRGRMVIGCSPIAGFCITCQCHYIHTLNIECTESLNSTQICHIWHCTKHD